MAKRIRYTPEQIINKLREAEVYLPEGAWYSLWDDSLFEGGMKHKLPASLD